MEIIKINDAKDETLKQIIELEEEAFQGYGNVDLWIIKALIRYGLVFILKEESKIITIIEFMKLFDENSVFLYGISTSKRYRNKGFAKKIIEYSEKYLKEKNIEKICLTVDPNNKIAINLYKKYGYTVESLLKDEYGNGVDRLLMSKKL